MAHGADIRITGDNAYGVGNALALCGGGGSRVRKAKNLPAKIQHGGLKA
jgi:hypothetical protein